MKFHSAVEAGRMLQDGLSASAARPGGAAAKSHVAAKRL
jgi:hypothetical protein